MLYKGWIHAVSQPVAWVPGDARLGDINVEGKTSVKIAKRRVASGLLRVINTALQAAESVKTGLQ